MIKELTRSYDTTLIDLHTNFSGIHVAIYDKNGPGRVHIGNGRIVRFLNEKIDRHDRNNDGRWDGENFVVDVYPYDTDTLYSFSKDSLVVTGIESYKWAGIYPGRFVDYGPGYGSEEGRFLLDDGGRDNGRHSDWLDGYDGLLGQHPEGFRDSHIEGYHLGGSFNDGIVLDDDTPWLIDNGFATNPFYTTTRGKSRRGIRPQLHSDAFSAVNKGTTCGEHVVVHDIVWRRLSVADRRVIRSMFVVLLVDTPRHHARWHENCTHSYDMEGFPKINNVADMKHEYHFDDEMHRGELLEDRTDRLNEVIADPHPEMSKLDPRAFGELRELYNDENAEV